MSGDVFGALLRAAGPLAAPRAAEPADPFELGVESSVAAVDGPAVPAESVASAPLVSGPVEASAASALALATAAAAAQPGVLRAEPAARRPPLPAAPPAAGDAAIHPAVQAALRWVRADPLGAESVVVSPPAAVSQSQVVLPQPLAATPVRREPPLSHAEPLPASSDRPSRGAELETAPEAPRLRRIERDERVAAALPQRRVEAPVPAGEAGVEVSIGSIHVTIEAPPAPPRAAPPATAATAAPPQRQPAAPRPASRNGFARNRLPRL